MNGVRSAAVTTVPPPLLPKHANSSINRNHSTWSSRIHGVTVMMAVFLGLIAWMTFFVVVEEAPQATISIATSSTTTLVKEQNSARLEPPASTDNSNGSDNGSQNNNTVTTTINSNNNRNSSSYDPEKCLLQRGQQGHWIQDEWHDEHESECPWTTFPRMKLSQVCLVLQRLKVDRIWTHGDTTSTTMGGLLRSTLGLASTQEQPELKIWCPYVAARPYLVVHRHDTMDLEEIANMADHENENGRRPRKRERHPQNGQRDVAQALLEFWHRRDKCAISSVVIPSPNKIKPVLDHMQYSDVDISIGRTLLVVDDDATKRFWSLLNSHVFGETDSTKNRNVLPPLVLAMPTPCTFNAHDSNNNNNHSASAAQWMSSIGQPPNNTNHDIVPYSYRHNAYRLPQLLPPSNSMVCFKNTSATLLLDLWYTTLLDFVSLDARPKATTHVGETRTETTPSTAQQKSQYCLSHRGVFGQWVLDWTWAATAQYETLGKMVGMTVANAMFRATPEQPFRKATAYRWIEHRQGQVQDLSGNGTRVAIIPPSSAEQQQQQQPPWASCPVHELRTPHQLCAVCQRLNIDQIWLAGDSMTLGMAQSFRSLVGFPKMGYITRMQDPLIMFCPNNKGGSRNYTIVQHYTRTDHNVTHDLDRKNKLGVGPTARMFLQRASSTPRSPYGRTAIVINLGVHFHSLPAFERFYHEMWNAIEKVVLSKNGAPQPPPVIFFKNSSPGHDGCLPNVEAAHLHNWTIPVPEEPYQSYEEYDPNTLNHEYAWHLVELFNEYAKQNLPRREFFAAAASDDAPFSYRHNVHYLNIFNMTVLRRDGHIGGKDCMHYYFPGPLDWWIHMWYSALLDLAELDEVDTAK